MRYFVIDPKAETITEGQFHKGWGDSERNLEQLRELIGCRTIEVSPFTSKNDKPGKHHDLILDEEGLFPEDQHFFWSKVIGQPLAGKAVVLGFDPETGDWKSCTLSRDQVKKRMAWMGDRHTTATICKMLEARKAAQ